MGGEQGVAGEAAHCQSETASANLSSCFELLSWRVNMLLLCTEPEDSVGKEGLLFEKHWSLPPVSVPLSPDGHCDEAQHCRQKTVK